MTVRPTARWAVGLAAAALLVGASGCTQDPNSVAAQAKAGDQKGYVSGDGAVESIPAAERGVPVELKGELLDGTVAGDVALLVAGLGLRRHRVRVLRAPGGAEEERSGRDPDGPPRGGSSRHAPAPGWAWSSSGAAGSL